MKLGVEIIVAGSNSVTAQLAITLVAAPQVQGHLIKHTLDLERLELLLKAGVVGMSGRGGGVHGRLEFGHRDGDLLIEILNRGAPPTGGLLVAEFSEQQFVHFIMQNEFAILNRLDEHERSQFMKLRLERRKIDRQPLVSHHMRE